MPTETQWAKLKASETPEKRAIRLAKQKIANDKRKDKLKAYWAMRREIPEVRRRILERMRLYNSTEERKAVQRINNKSPKRKVKLEQYRLDGRRQAWDKKNRRKAAERKAIVELAKLREALEVML